MSALLDGGWTLGGGLTDAYYRGGTLLLGETTRAGKVPKVCVRLGNGGAGVIPRDPEWDESRLSVVLNPHPLDPMLYRVSLPWSSRLVKCSVDG